MKSLVNYVLEKIRFKSKVVIPEINEIVEFNLTNLKNINKVGNTDIEVTRTIDKAEELSNNILDFLVIKFGIKIEITEWEKINEFISKGLIELILIYINNIVINDIVKLLTEMIVMNIDKIDIDAGKIDKIYLSKELEMCIVDQYSDIDKIINDLIMENTVIKQLIKDKSKFMLIPLKWITITDIKVLGLNSNRSIFLKSLVVKE